MPVSDAIGQRKIGNAVRILANLLDQGQQPIMILGMIARHLRLLVKAKALMAERLPPSDAARLLGVHPFFARNYFDQAEYFTADELRGHLRQLAGCDRSLKSSRLPREMVIERLVLSLCRKRNDVSGGKGVKQGGSPVFAG